MSGLAAVGTLWNAARSEPARDGAGESRHAHDRGREESGVAAAETDGTDDPVLPAGPVRGHPRADRDQSRGDAVSEASPRDALRSRITLMAAVLSVGEPKGSASRGTGCDRMISRGG